MRARERHRRRAEQRYRDRWGCLGKTDYPTWAGAEYQATYLNRRLHRVPPFQPYCCRLCGSFHIGTAPPKDKV